MAIYKAKKSNLTTLLNKSNIDFKTLSENTGIPLVNLSDYSKRKIMSISTAMTVSKELGCTIEELYEWNKTE
ncbi:MULTISPECIES: helix-turn-helix domain-containing protein [Bacillaceae]|uniref:DNA-binding Xre family transcriptional regulator n=1 Tax=Peribacillus huizhouensis TaxID=1501239 RepID=A0ABR6CJ65_9BACI|nr:MULTISPECIES: helix-turn-helix transcriptional regulator [Bacillaceae]MBA9024741.1 DNA-binding Xre family transcriptional regulator [Peribacillus huizhouensis]